ncbi:hypothetical protein [Caloramator sp. Dgby_cultured_2]|uniref:hypothetical protein n=1 Tax=Caloramator sp. Dgby_cultured_2 TaxID=3029174 RepID=UPI00237E5E7F|nr:hypothetical protein [Caloramator sp. Dgby_cultured_2]WDU83847.1 hypothetical protein PWK10_04850 [Caloramator sp. Dgby_cultured_2]
MKNIKQEDIKAIQDCYILGHLALDEKFFPSIGEEQKPITYLKKILNMYYFILNQYQQSLKGYTNYQDPLKITCLLVLKKH